MLSVLLWLWQLPQNIVGLVYARLSKSQLIARWGHVAFYRHNSKYGSVSLGDFIFLSQHAARKTMLHEYGHHRQSLRFGPLYLIVVGLPSVTWATLRSMGFFKSKSYFWLWCEKWANDLGAVQWTDDKTDNPTLL